MPVRRAPSRVLGRWIGVRTAEHAAERRAAAFLFINTSISSNIEKLHVTLHVVVILTSLGL